MAVVLLVIGLKVYSLNNILSVDIDPSANRFISTAHYKFKIQS